MRSFVRYSRFIRLHRVTKKSRRFWMRRLLYMHSVGHSIDGLLRMTVV